MDNFSYYDENWLRCLGDYCTECDGSRKLGKTISDEIIELNGMFDEYNSEDNSTKRVGFRITRIILLGIRLDEVLMAVKDYHSKLVAGNVDEVIPLGFWKRAISYQWLEDKPLGNDLTELKNVSLATEKFPKEINGHETKTGHDLELWIREGIHELKTLLRTIRSIISNLPNSCYGKIYEKQSEHLNIEPVQRFFDWWKMSVDEVNLENLLALQFRVLNDFVNSGILRFSPHQDLESNATMFVKTATREGYVYNINRNVYGKYICQHILEFEPHERMALYQLEKLLKLIRQEIQNLPPDKLKKEAKLYEPEVKAEVKKSAKMEPELTPVDRFVNRVKDIMMEATKRNGERIVTNTRAWQGEYTFFVDGERIAVMMDDLRKNYEEKITEFLEPYQRCDGVSVVAPFIGRMLDIEELRAKDLQKSDLDFAFSPYYNNGASAVKKMSNKLDDDTNVLFGTFEGLLKKYPSTLFS